MSLIHFFELISENLLTFPEKEMEFKKKESYTGLAYKPFLFFQLHNDTLVYSEKHHFDNSVLQPVVRLDFLGEKTRFYIGDKISVKLEKYIEVLYVCN